MSDDGLQIENISHYYVTRSERVWALHNISLRVRSGEFICVVGPSGCGKSTLLRVLTGLLAPSEGHVFLGGMPVTGPGLDRGIVFQEPALFPWLTVEGNIKFALREAELPRAQIDIRSREVLDVVGLHGYESLYPRQLSGGMRSRVAVARAWALPDTHTLLMDEPFAALDAITRRRLQDYLADLWGKRPKTSVYITHDIEEAIYLADRIIIMKSSPGEITREVSVDMQRPRNRDSAEFADRRAEVELLLDAASEPHMAEIDRVG